MAAETILKIHRDMTEGSKERKYCKSMAYTIAKVFPEYSRYSKNILLKNIHILVTMFKM